MFPTLLIIGILSCIDQTTAVGVCVIVFSALFIVGFAASWGPVLWVLVGEMYPYRTRGKAASAAVMSNWIFTTIIGASFPAASSASLSACFFFFAAMISSRRTTSWLCVVSRAINVWVASPCTCR